MAKITPIDIIKGVSRKFGGGNSKEYFATNKCSYHIRLAKRVNSYVRAPFNLRSSSVHPPFELRSSSVRRSKIDRRTNGESSEAKRRCIETLMGSQGKDDPNKNFIFNHLNSNYGKTYSWLHHFYAPSHSAYSLYTAHVWWHEKRTRVSVFICN